MIRINRDKKKLKQKTNQFNITLYRSYVLLIKHKVL